MMGKYQMKLCDLLSLYYVVAARIFIGIDVGEQ